MLAFSLSSNFRELFGTVSSKSGETDVFVFKEFLKCAQKAFGFSVQIFFSFAIFAFLSYFSYAYFAHSRTVFLKSSLLVSFFNRIHHLCNCFFSFIILRISTLTLSIRRNFQNQTFLKKENMQL